jgi:hypothetical protein
MVVTALLLGALALRWRRTRPWHADFGPRMDAARLAAVALGAQALELIRARVRPGSGGFWILSLALLPFVACALSLLWRLYRAYRTPAFESAAVDSGVSRRKER